MATSNLVLNPYQPISIENSPTDWLSLNPHARLEFAVEKRWLFRRFRLIGYINTEILWDARSATEFVKVHGVKAASKTSFFYVPRFEFEIPTGERSLPAAIDVRIAWLVRVTAFRLTIDNEEIYREGAV